MINLSQLKSDKIRVLIPLYIGEEFIDNIEIYNPTREEVEQIKVCVQNGQINEDFIYRLIVSLTNINMDCELDEEFDKYYNETFEAVKSEINKIIFEIATDFMAEVNMFNEIPENKAEVLSNVLESFDKSIKENEEKSKEIELQKAKDAEKRELLRQKQELEYKLSQIEGD